VESPSVATGITTGTVDKNDYFNFQNRGVATIVFVEKLWKTKENKDKASLQKPDCESGSQLLVEKVLAPHSARLKTVPLTE